MKINQMSVSEPEKIQKVERVAANQQQGQAMNETAKEKPSHQESVNKEQLIEMVDGANKFFDFSRTQLKFQLHEDLDRYYVLLKHEVTDEVIKEIPDKKFLDMVAKLRDFIGVLVDEKI